MSVNLRHVSCSGIFDAGLPTTRNKHVDVHNIRECGVESTVVHFKSAAIIWAVMEIIHRNFPVVILTYRGLLMYKHKLAKAPCGLRGCKN